MNKSVIACVEDLFFRSKIDAAARNVNVPVRFASRVEALCKEVDASTAAALVELSPSGKALEAVRALKSHAATRLIPVIGFLSHMDKKLAADAMQAGVDRVMPRSQFSETLPDLLLEYVSPGAKRTVEEEPELPEE